MTGDDLAASRCPACGEVVVPPRPRCPACGRAMEDHRVAGSGTLLTWTRVERPPEGFEPGRVVGVVRLDAGPTCLAESASAAGEVPLDAPVTVEAAADGRLVYRSR